MREGDRTFIYLIFFSPNVEILRLIKSEFVVSGNYEFVPVRKRAWSDKKQIAKKWNLMDILTHQRIKFFNFLDRSEIGEIAGMNEHVTVLNIILRIK